MKNRNYNGLIKLTAAVLTASIALTACAAPGTEGINSSIAADIITSEGQETASDSTKAGQAADYLMQAAGKYGRASERSDVLAGFQEEEAVTWIQLLVLAGRAFGELPAPEGAAKLMASPSVNLSSVPEWAKAELQNLANGGILAPSDLGQAEQTEISAEQNTSVDTEKPATMKDLENLTSRFHARFGTSLNDDFYHTVNKGEMFAGGASTVTANTNRQLHELILELTESGNEYPTGSSEQKIRDLYLSVLDTELRNREGIKPLEKYFSAVDNARDYSELNAAIALAVNELGNSGNGLFPMIAVADTEDSSRYIMQLLTMPANLSLEDYNNEEDKMPETGAKNDIELADLRGVDYDDAKWDELLDNMTISDMDTVIALGGYQTAAASSVGKIQTIDCDGPASINNNFTGTGSIGFPSAVMIACTWNDEIAMEFGESIGKMADEMGVSGWYAPAMNIHRSAFAGRNFEYYSEDGLLSGKIAANAVVGAEKYGVYAYLKHFALNDQETNRTSMLCTWSNEQAIREIYLKPFEICVKEGKAKAVMSSFNYIGTRWAGGSEELCNTVLRDEWGFQGFVLTDYFGVYGYMNSDQGIRNGTDAMLVAYDTETNHVKDQKSATGVEAMRQACKNIMYTVVNSRAYDAENLETGLMTWQIAAIAADVVLGVGILALEIVAIKRFRKRLAEEKAAVAVEN